MTKMELAEKIQANMKSEAEAIIGYTELLNDPSLPEFVKDAITEIIGDEQNHQNKLWNLYSEITGIEPATD